jgi:hypothetical protein
MAGPQDIQRFPRGLVDLLGMRATGDTPHTLAQSTVGMIEMLDLYTNDRLQTASLNLSVAINAIGQATFLNSQVPPGELWLIYQATLLCQPTAAATALKVAAGIRRGGPNGSPSGVQLVTEQLSLGASDGGVVGQTFSRPLLALPGQDFVTQCQFITGVPAVNPTLNLWYTRIGI